MRRKNNYFLKNLLGRAKNAIIKSISCKIVAIKIILLFLHRIMKFLIKDIKLSQVFKSNELLWTFCILFSTASVFFGNNNFVFEKQYDSSGLTVNKTRTHHDLGTTCPANSLSAFDFIEESETTDDSNEDDIIEGHYSPDTLTFFTCNIPENSLVSGSLSLSKRVFIPLFLLHHSWKIPVA